MRDRADRAARAAALELLQRGQAHAGAGDAHDRAAPPRPRRAARRATSTRRPPRWAAQFGLHAARARVPTACCLSCDDEPYCARADRRRDRPRPGPRRLGARARLRARAGARAPRGVRRDADAGRRRACTPPTPTATACRSLPYREPASRLVAHARPASGRAAGHPRKLGHVNFLTGALDEQLRFYTEALGMRITDWLGDGGVWLYINSDHHVMALIDKGAAHFHHLAFDVVDIGQMRMALDHLGRHGRWLGWGPVRHGVGRQHRLLRAHRRGGVLRRALLRHGAAPGRPRAAALARQPLLVQHLGAAAAALLLPLRRGGDRVRAREPRDARASRWRTAPGPEDDGVMTLQGYTVPRTPRGQASLVPPPPWHYVADFLVVDFHADPDAAVSLLPAGPRAPPRPGPLRRRVSPTGSRARRTATSSSTRCARTTASSTSWSAACSTARRSPPARSSGSTRTSRWPAAGSRASPRSSARCG